MKIRRVGRNLLLWYPEQWCCTILPDGVTVYAHPHRNPGYLHAAKDHGYVWAEDPAWEYCREHDALHTLLSVELGLPESPTLRDVSNKIDRAHLGDAAVPGYQWIEEGRTLDLAVYLNTGDKGHSLHSGALFELSWEIDLEDFRRRALAFLRSDAEYLAWEEQAAPELRQAA